MKRFPSKAVERLDTTIFQRAGSTPEEAATIARRLVDVPFLGPVLADDLNRRLGRETSLAMTAPESVDLTGSLVGVV